MTKFLKKFIGTAQTRTLKQYKKIVTRINRLEEEYQGLTEDKLKAKTGEFKERLLAGETVDALLPEAFAVVKNTCRRLCGLEIHVSGYTQKWDMVPYDVQLLGAIGMHYGAIAEMQTGEGKTLTASMPLYLNALTGKPVHLVTVNDYLAERDCEWIGAIFRYLGLTSKPLKNQTPSHERKEVYAADIVYGTASEFGFDYLRDNSMAHSKDDQGQRGHYFAIIDEVDSILVDEARTPLIISGPAGQSKQMYGELKDAVSRVVRYQRDFCTKLATEANRTLDKLGMLTEENIPSLDKAQKADLETALKQLWLVSKGMPRNRIVKRIKENPDLRAKIEEWETYFYGEANKQEKLDLLADLYIVIDERASDHELTDKGIDAWSKIQGEESRNDFLMLDLGHEYAEIDNADLPEQEKMQRKVDLREEDSLRKERAHNLRQLFRAHLLMEKDVEYIIQEQKIVIIDENTGRPQPGRRFSDGLHQAIEAKEGLSIQQETQTYATITLQNYFRMYDKLAGMTGTAITEAGEFKEIYKLDVLEIPTHKPCVRDDSDDQVYMTEREKYNAIITEIKEVHAQGRPILIGTESVEVSEKIARILKQNKLSYTMLNAKNHASEAEIISKAGANGAITVSTNMAGRGTDIKLGEGVADLGGLHVVGTTRHQSRRIDRQLRGRCARQGDPGSSKFFVSFEDSLMRLFTSPKLTAFLQRFRPPEGEPITANILNKSIETAQKRIEQRNYSIRKHTLEYDDVMNKQRAEVYTFRNDILTGDNILDIATDLLESCCFDVGSNYLSDKPDVTGYCNFLMTHFPITLEESSLPQGKGSADAIEQTATDLVLDAFKKKCEFQRELIKTMSSGEANPETVLREVLRSIILRHIDREWQMHLHAIDHLRTEVNVRTVAQKDPLIEFKHEAFALFKTLNERIKEEVGHALFKFEIAPPPKTEASSRLRELQNDGKKSGIYLASPPLKDKNPS